MHSKRVFVKYKEQSFKCVCCGKVKGGSPVPIDRWLTAIDILTMQNVNATTNIPVGWSINGHLKIGGYDIRCNEC